MSDQPATPLPAQFTALGFVHTLVATLGRWRIYRRSKPGGREHFEVIRPVIRKTTYIDGAWQPCEPREAYPSPEQWGTDAFTCQSEDRARAKLATLAA